VVDKGQAVARRVDKNVQGVNSSGSRGSNRSMINDEVFRHILERCNGIRVALLHGERTKGNTKSTEHEYCALIGQQPCFTGVERKRRPSSKSAAFFQQGLVCESHELFLVIQLLVSSCLAFCFCGHV